MIIFLALSLTGCGCFTTKPEKIIYIEKPVKCKRAHINTPDSLAINNVTKSMTMEDKVKAILAELETYVGYTKELEAALNICTDDTELLK